MRKAFTLMEVNLAIGILAMGIMSIISLYSFSYREGSQSGEDVGSAAFAEAVFGELTAALTSTNRVPPSRFLSLDNKSEIKGMTEVGWNFYLDKDNPERVDNNTASTAQAVFMMCGGKGIDFSGGFNGLIGALVIQHTPGSRLVRIGFRATRELTQLMAQPLYYTEVCYPESASSSTQGEQ